MSRQGSVKRDASGAWMFVVDLAPPGAPRKQVKRRGFRTKAEALDALDQVKNAGRTGTFVDPDRITLGDYLGRWVDGLAAVGRRTSTIDGYRRYVDRYVQRWPIGDVPVQSLTALHLDELYADMRRRGLAASTVRQLHAIVGKALGDAERKGLVSRNVARLAEPPAAKAARAPEPKVWTPEQLSTFLGAVAGHHHGAMFRLGAMTGLRRGELCGLRWEDLDLDAEPPRLRVRQSVTATHHTENGKRVVALEVGDVKTAKSRRTVDLDPGTVTVLRRHRKAQAADRLLVGAGYSDHGLVFAMPDGRPWNPETISQAFERLVAATDVPRIRLHDLRHTHATHVLATGANPRIVSERLGHASVAFTLDVYGHVLPGQQADAAAAVAALVDRL